MKDLIKCAQQEIEEERDRDLVKVIKEELRQVKRWEREIEDITRWIEHSKKQIQSIEKNKSMNPRDGFIG